MKLEEDLLALERFYYDMKLEEDLLAIDLKMARESRRSMVWAIGLLLVVGGLYHGRAYCRDSQARRAEITNAFSQQAWPLSAWETADCDGESVTITKRGGFLDTIITEYNFPLQQVQTYRTAMGLNTYLVTSGEAADPSATDPHTRLSGAEIARRFSIARKAHPQIPVCNRW